MRSIGGRRLAGYPLVLLLTMVSPNACSAGGPADPAGLDHVRAIVLPFLTSTPFHIAAEEGYFLDQGLDVEFVRLARTQDSMTALARGQVDVGTGMLTVTVLNSVARGARVRLVGAMARLAPEGCPFNAVVVRRELMESGQLTSADGVRGLSWDLDLMLPHGYWVDRLLEPLDLTIEDIVIKDVPEPAAVVAVANGTLDVAVPSEPFLSQHLATGETVIWRPTKDVVPDYVISLMSYGPTLLDERPEVGERFAAAVLKGMERFRQGKTPENLATVQAGTGLDAERVAGACWPAPSQDGRVDGAGFRGFQEWAVSRGLVDRILEDAELIDPRFIEGAHRRLLPAGPGIQ